MDAVAHQRFCAVEKISLDLGDHLPGFPVLTGQEGMLEYCVRQVLFNIGDRRTADGRAKGKDPAADPPGVLRPRQKHGQQHQPFDEHQAVFIDPHTVPDLKIVSEKDQRLSRFFQPFKGIFQKIGLIKIILVSDRDIPGMGMGISVIPVLGDSALTVVDQNSETIPVRTLANVVIGSGGHQNDLRFYGLGQERTHAFIQIGALPVSADCKNMCLLFHRFFLCIFLYSELSFFIRGRFLHSKAVSCTTK